MNLLDLTSIIWENSGLAFCVLIIWKVWKQWSRMGNGRNNRYLKNDHDVKLFCNDTAQAILSSEILGILYSIQYFIILYTYDDVF